MIFIGCNNGRTYEEVTNFEREYKFDFEIEEKVQKDTVPWKHQLSAGEYALKGSYKKALKEWGKVMRGRELYYSEKEIDSLKANFTLVNAKQEIVAQSKETSIVIINEAHHNTFHRLFTKSLLKDLYETGYRYLGLEALMNGDEKDAFLNTRKYPIKKSGYYTNDPNFSKLIREATAIGYQVFSYEQTSGVNGKEREIEQAKNIQEILKTSKGKILIHCGFDHVLEGSKRGWEKAMAGRIKEFTGVDPLTVNQTQFSERGEERYNHPMLKALQVKESSVLKNKHDSIVGYTRRNSWTDIAVLHPTIEEEEGQVVEKNSIEHVLNFDKIDLEYPLMVLGFKEGDDIHKAVPILVTELKGKKSELKLLLPQKGTYIFVVVNKENRAVKFKESV
ncbi:conserved protein of unknown function [Tenacibaculum sp. 190130A14a]|uniref:Uncharacterized protein n=1 Tax=Tenacibaculum polynesiense TaxID=3137857 RepID=A0ABP1EWB7_9FLAO